MDSVWRWVLSKEKLVDFDDVIQRYFHQILSRSLMSQGQNEPLKKERVGFSQSTFQENKKCKGSLDDPKKV